MIRVEDLAKRYGTVVAVDGLSFDVESGETFALIGPNGAGKTTTLKMLLGLARPDRGRIQLGRLCLPPDDPRARHDVGYVPQRVEFPAARTVAEVLGFFAALRGLPRQAVDRALDRVRLASHAARPAHQLSGGYLQRLSLTGLEATQVLELLGVRTARNSIGRVTRVEPVPLEELGRHRGPRRARLRPLEHRDRRDPRRLA